MGRVGLQIMALKSFLAALDEQDAYLLDTLTTNDIFKRELGPTRALDALKVLFEEINAFSSGLTSPFQYTSNPNTLRAQINAARMRITSRIEELNLTNNEESFQMEKDLSMPKALDKRRVFVVHGRNMDARKAIFDFLPRINLDPIEWEEAVEMAGSTSALNLNAIERAFSHAQSAVIILPVDDLARLGKRYLSEHDDAYERNLTRQARPNGIFEAGMAFGLYTTRTVIVSFGKTRPISDIAGINILHLSDTPESRQKLAGRLKNAACDVSTDGKTDWLKAGDFASAFHGDPDQVDKHAGLKIARRRASADETATYKPKLWVELRNDSDSCLEVKHLGSLETRAGVHIRNAFQSMQLKIGKHWCPKD